MPNSLKSVASGNILLVEDDAGDRMLTEKIFKSCSNDLVLHWVEDGEQALNFVRRKGPFEKMPRPDLVLLDLNLPRKDGAEVLAEIRADAKLNLMPVIIFSTSKAPADIQRSYQLGANAFVSKPGELVQFRLAIEAIHAFWFKLAKLPRL